MAVHLPLSPEAQAEARILMLSSNNILKPSDGRPVTLPSQDMIIGLYHLTTKRVGSAGEGRIFTSPSEAIMAHDAGVLHLNSKVKIRLDDFVPYEGWEAPEGWEPGQPALVETSLGQVIFNDTLPADYPWVEKVADKGQLSEFIPTPIAGHGLVVYVEDRAPNPAEQSQKWVRTQLRSELAGAASASRWQDWCAWNLKRMGFTTTPGTSVEAPSDEDSLEEN